MIDGYHQEWQRKCLVDCIKRIMLSDFNEINFQNVEGYISLESNEVLLYPSVFENSNFRAEYIDI